MNICNEEGIGFKTCTLGSRGTGKIFIRNMTYSCPVWFVKICEKGDQMKIDRLIGILSILLQKEMTTAPELADHFEVTILKCPGGRSTGILRISAKREYRFRHLREPEAASAL